MNQKASVIRMDFGANSWRVAPSAVLTAILIASCASPSQEPGDKLAAKAEVATEFADNTESFKTKNANEDAVKTLIALNLKTGYETFDLPRIASVLASDFELRFIASEATVLVDTKQNYLTERGAWKKTERPVRELLYSIRGMTTDEKEDTITVITASTYKSKHFSPRFIEALLFQKISDDWKLKRQVMLPLSPRRPEFYNVDIFVTGKLQDIPKWYAEKKLAAAPDEFIDRFRRERLTKVPADNVPRTVFIVFREPPPVGAEITVRHSWWSANVRHPPPKSFHYTVEKSDPYFVILNKSWVGTGLGEIIYEVFVDGEKVVEQRVKT